MHLVDVRFDAQGAALALARGLLGDAMWLGQLDTGLSEVIGFVAHAQESVSATGLEPLADGALVLARIDTATTAPVIRRSRPTDRTTSSGPPTSAPVLLV